MKNPSIELYEVLIAAAESKNLFQAAEKLKISQPAVSVKLKELESQTPLPLFSFEGKRKVLTHYGRELYRIAKANQDSLAAGYEQLNRQYASAESLTLKVGARRELFETVAPLLKFGGKISFKSLSSAEAVENLLDHRVDIAISYILPDSPEIIAKKVIESSAKLVVHKKFLKGRSSAGKLIYDHDFLVETPCVLYQEDGHLLKEWVEHVKIPFENLKAHAVADDWRSIQALVDAGWGYGIVPSYVEASNKDIVSILMPNEVLPKFIFHALFNKNLRKIPAFKSILEFKTVT